MRKGLDERIVSNCLIPVPLFRQLILLSNLVLLTAVHHLSRSTIALPKVNYTPTILEPNYAMGGVGALIAYSR